MAHKSILDVFLDNHGLTHIRRDVLGIIRDVVHEAKTAATEYERLTGLQQNCEHLAALCMSMALPHTTAWARCAGCGSKFIRSKAPTGFCPACSSRAVRVIVHVVDATTWEVLKVERR